MTTLLMEVETVRNAQTNMVNTHQQLTGLVQGMTSAVNGLQGAWVGNSATEFFGLYDEWRSRMNSALEELSQMASRLQAEIAEWEQMASKLA